MKKPNQRGHVQVNVCVSAPTAHSLRLLILIIVLARSANPAMITDRLWPAFVPFLHSLLVRRDREYPKSWTRWTRLIGRSLLRPNLLRDDDLNYCYSREPRGRLSEGAAGQAVLTMTSEQTNAQVPTSRFRQPVIMMREETVPLS